MLTIHITQEFQNAHNMAEALEIIAVRVRHNQIQWRSPDYHITSDE